MRYENIHRAVFLARPNRFIAQVLLEGREETVHVKNTGRCRELLVPGCTVYLERSDDPARKTGFDLVAVEKERPGLPALLINMDAQAPNKVFGEWAAAGKFRPGLTLLRPETAWGSSRFDFYWEAGPEMGPPRELPQGDPVGRGGAAKRTSPHVYTGARDVELVPTRGFVEVKGVTLERDGAVYFPDAPTERGVKHLRELILAKAAGYEAAVCFVVQMGEADFFAPNDATHRAFGAALREAAGAGVEVLAYGCAVTPDSLALRAPVKVRL